MNAALHLVLVLLLNMYLIYPKEEKIEPYVEGKYYEIGEKFSYKGSIAKVTKASDRTCEGCAFLYANECITASCAGITFKTIFKPIDIQSDKSESLDRLSLLAELLKLGADFAKTEVSSERQSIVGVALDLFDNYIQEHYEDK